MQLAPHTSPRRRLLDLLQLSKNDRSSSDNGPDDARCTCGGGGGGDGVRAFVLVARAGAGAGASGGAIAAADGVRFCGACSAPVGGGGASMPTRRFEASG